jgi:hypothetical protein
VNAAAMDTAPRAVMGVCRLFRINFPQGICAQRTAGGTDWPCSCSLNTFEVRRLPDQTLCRRPCNCPGSEQSQGPSATLRWVQTGVHALP